MPCIGNVPSIVASGSIDKPSGGNISATTVYTPSDAGVYRISIYATMASGFGGGAATSVTWTDDRGARNAGVPFGNLQGSSNNDAGAVIAFRALADAIQLSTDMAGSSSVAYTLYYVIEQLA